MSQHNITLVKENIYFKHIVNLLTWQVRTKHRPKVQVTGLRIFIDK